MEYSGKILKGVVVFDGPSPLPEGSRVRISRIADDDRAASLDRLRNSLRSVAGIAENLPPDMAQEHNHYAHGAPKRSQQKP